MSVGEPICIALFKDEGEAREVHLVQRERGGVHVIQNSWGDLTLLAFGERAVCQRLSLDQQDAALLAARMGWVDGIRAGLARFFSTGDAALCDLLDICTHAGIACAYSLIGGSLGALSAGSSVGEAAPVRSGRLSLVP